MKSILITLCLILVCYTPLFSQAGESLAINWPEEYNWKIGSNQETDELHMIELIPGDEEITNWSIIGTMLAIKGVANVPMDKAMNLMFDEAKKNASKASLTLIEKQEATKPHWIIFKIEAPRFNDDKNPESQLYYIIQGQQTLYSNFVALKEKKLSDSFVKKWAAVFKASELIYDEE